MHDCNLHNEKYTRRDFLTKTSLGLGALTLSSLIDPVNVLGRSPFPDKFAGS